MFRRKQEVHRKDSGHSAGGPSPRTAPNLKSIFSVACCGEDERDQQNAPEKRRLFSFGSKRRKDFSASAGAFDHKRMRSEDVNPSVFFDLTCNGKDIGTLYVEVFLEEQPIASHAFLDLVVGEKLAEEGNKPLYYKGTRIVRLDRDTLAGGDFGGLPQHSRPVYSIQIAHANRELGHTGRGTVWMPMFSENRIGSQFIVSLKDTPWLASNHVVVGKLIGGFETFDQLMSMRDVHGGGSDAEFGEVRIKYCEKL